MYVHMQSRTQRSLFFSFFRQYVVLNEVSMTNSYFDSTGHRDQTVRIRSPYISVFPCPLKYSVSRIPLRPPAQIRNCFRTDAQACTNESQFYLPVGPVPVALTSLLKFGYKSLVENLSSQVKMFSRLSTVAFYALSALAILAAATPGGQPTTTTVPVTTTITVTAPGTTATEPASSCSTGELQCCDSTEEASSAAGSLLLGLIGVVLQDVNVLLGVTCSPITVIGVGNSGCSAQAVCCEDNAWGGLVSIGCVPVTL
ncbi:fungal hydrophobin [Lentinula edodes]|uniref:Hydrophobin n=1 Tax=Lentinula edodes TaxID=5353 RepID=A0A1Q3EFA1_LENED|nr:fungal hydrophobin [Lentinula edodes]